MGKMSVSATFDIPLYGGRIKVHVTKDIKKTLKEVHYGGNLECDACCIYNLNGTAKYDLIFRDGLIQHGLIAHECFHLTHRIMKGVNKPYDVNNDEPEAYLMQFITQNIYSFLKKNKIKIKT